MIKEQSEEKKKLDFYDKLVMQFPKEIHAYPREAFDRQLKQYLKDLKLAPK